MFTKDEHPTSADGLYRQAALVRSEGSPSRAAWLFALSASRYEDDALRRKATLQAMACYVLAEMENEAAIMAVILSIEAECLSRGELFKVNAVLKRMK